MLHTVIQTIFLYIVAVNVLKMLPLQGRHSVSFCSVEGFAFVAWEHIKLKLVKTPRCNFSRGVRISDNQYFSGGQISFDCFPIGWDKTYCLKHVQNDGFTNIHFFGDKTNKGGNDYELFKHEAVIGHTVTSPGDTIQQLTEIFYSWLNVSFILSLVVCIFRVCYDVLPWTVSRKHSQQFRLKETFVDNYEFKRRLILN